MSKWYTVKDGKIDRIQSGNSPVGNADWHEAPNDWKGQHGDKLEWFDSAMRRIPDGVLVEQGKRIDNKGVVYNINDKTSRVIYDYDEELAEDETKEAPLEKEPYQKFDRVQNKWVVETEKKERAKKESDIAKIKAQIESAEKKIIRPLRAMQGGRATQNDLDKFDELDTIIEDELRPELNRLEDDLNELMSA